MKRLKSFISECVETVKVIKLLLAVNKKRKKMRREQTIATHEHFQYLEKTFK